MFYRVRKSWADKDSQLGAYEVLENAKDMSDKNDGFFVFDENGKVVYPINYLKKAAEFVVKVYKAVIDNKCIHKGGAKKFADITAKHIITCSASMSIVLQEAGCLPVGKIVSHTKASGLNGASLIRKKNNIDKCMNGWENLVNCEIICTNKVYEDLPDDLKEAGVCYIYDSDCAVSAGDSKIYSCNEGSSQLNKLGQYIKNLMSGGYCFTHTILYCIKPNTK